MDSRIKSIDDFLDKDDLAYIDSIINSKAFNFKSNYSRYLYACNILKIKDIKSFDFFSNIICQLINENNIKHGYAKIHISRSG